MTFRTVIDALTEQSDALRVAVEAKKETLDAAEAVAVASAAVVVGKQPGAEANAATAAAKATEATNNAAQIAAYKTAAAALDTSTTATAAVTNLLPDLLAKKDPARHPFRKKLPTLVLDFERQKCHRYSPSTGFGETPLATFMTFARNSTATYTGPDGLLKTAAANEARYDYDPLTGECKGLLVEEQRTNLFPFSTQLHNPSAFHVRVSCTTTPAVDVFSPDGSLTATVFRRTSASAAYTSISLPTASRATVSQSIYLRRLDCDYASLRLQDNTTYVDQANMVVNLATGTIAQAAEASGVYTSVSGSLTYVGNGWYRATLSAVVNADLSTRFLVSFSDQNSKIDGSSTSATVGGYLWGAQLEAGAFPTSYIPTPATFTGRASTKTYFDSNGVLQTAASGVAVTDYGYVDGRWVSKGLSLEPQATNLLIQSQDFSGWSTNWVTPPTISRNTAISPSGIASCADITFTTDSSQNDGLFIFGPSIPANTVYTASVFLKKSVGSTLRIRIEGDVCFGGTSDIYFDQTTGNILQQKNIGATFSVNVVNYGAWYRICVTRTTIAAGNVNVCFYSGVAGTNRFVIYGAQLETGPVATSYIPTTTAQVTRAADTSTSAQATRVADDAKVDGTKFSDFYNQLAGTAVTEFSAGMLGGAGYPGAFSVSDGGVNNRFGCCISDGDGDRVQTNLRVNGTYATAVFSAQAVTVGQAAKIGVRISRAGWSGAVSGGSTVGTGAAVMPQTMSILKVGVFDTPLNGPVKRITYYPQPFTNEELQAATSA